MSIPAREPCPVPSCDRDKPVNYLLCKRCWSRGTKKLKDGIWASIAEIRDRNAPREQRIMAADSHRAIRKELIELVDAKLIADAQKADGSGS